MIEIAQTNIISDSFDINTRQNFGFTAIRYLLHSILGNIKMPTSDMWAYFGAGAAAAASSSHPAH